MRLPERPSKADENYIIPPELDDAPHFMLAFTLLGGIAMWLGFIFGLLMWAL